MAGNRFNDPPPAGFEYILARFRVQIQSLVDQNVPIDMNHARFDGVRQDGAVYNQFPLGSGVDPDLRTSLFAGVDYKVDLLLGGDQ